MLSYSWRLRFPSNSRVTRLMGNTVFHLLPKQVMENSGKEAERKHREPLHYTCPVCCHGDDKQHTVGDKTPQRSMQRKGRGTRMVLGHSHFTRGWGDKEMKRKHSRIHISTTKMTQTTFSQERIYIRTKFFFFNCQRASLEKPQLLHI